MAVLVYVPNAMPSFGLDGQPVIAQLQFYENETLTPATVYADAALSTELTWPLVSDTSGNFPAVWSPDDGLYTVVWSTNDGQTDTWDSVSGETTANGAILAGAQTAQAAAEAAQTAAEAAQTAAETAETSSQDILDQILAIGGYNGYSPILAVATDGARRVLQITDWTGGAGTKPSTGYLGVSGIVANIADGVDIRGSATGDVSQSGSVTAGHFATWVGTGQIQDGGAVGGMSALDLASQAEAEAGTSNTKGMSPLRVAQAIAALANTQLPLLSKSANYQLLAADRGSLVSCTSTFTLSFSAAATLGNNWFAYLYNAGTGDITLDPSGSETIDGLTSFIMYPGEIRIVRCNGTALTSYVLKGFSKTFTASGTFTKPAGYTDFEGEAWGGGGSGCADCGAGGGGACAQFNIPAPSFGTTETVTIGAGGAAVNGASGNGGGNTTLGTLVTAYGGAGGNNNAGGGGGGLFSAGSGATGGAPRISGGDNPGFGGGDGGANGVDVAGYRSVYGGGGGGGLYINTTKAGGNSIYGGAGGGGGWSGNFALGGTSRYGGGGGAGSSSGNGVAGTAPGGGGGGCISPNTSGAGARGELRIRGVA